MGMRIAAAILLFFSLLFLAAYVVDEWENMGVAVTLKDVVYMYAIATYFRLLIVSIGGSK